MKQKSSQPPFRVQKVTGMKNMSRQPPFFRAQTVKQNEHFAMRQYSANSRHAPVRPCWLICDCELVSTCARGKIRNNSPQTNLLELNK